MGTAPSQLTDYEIRHFWSRVDIRSDDECWSWRGACCRTRSSCVFVFGNKHASAQRVAFVCGIGPVPENVCVNRCRVSPICVNPNHLSLKTGIPNSDYHKEYRKINKTAIDHAISVWRKRNPDKVRVYRQRTNRVHRAKLQAMRNAYAKARYHSDTIFRLRRLARCRYRDILKSKGLPKLLSTFRAIGCTPEFLRDYIQARFQPGMRWENIGEWEIDHRRPLSLATTPEEIVALCHYTNLQPLWKAHNRAKGATP